MIGPCCCKWWCQGWHKERDRRDGVNRCAWICLRGNQTLDHSWWPDTTRALHCNTDIDLLLGFCKLMYVLSFKFFYTFCGSDPLSYHVVDCWWVLWRGHLWLSHVFSMIWTGPSPDPSMHSLICARPWGGQGARHEAGNSDLEAQHQRQPWSIRKIWSGLLVVHFGMASLQVFEPSMSTLLFSKSSKVQIIADLHIIFIVGFFASLWQEQRRRRWDASRLSTTVSKLS